MKFSQFELTFDRTLIMGILNVTPDSFSDGGKFLDANAAIAQAKQMVHDGADIIDIGGESSRPGSEPVSEQEELRRVLPVIRALAPAINVPISIDTYKPAVAQQTLEAGACMINDITGLRDGAMIAVAAKHHVPVVLMHIQGRPKTMQEHPVYDDVIADIKRFFVERIAAAEQAGISDIILDPGIGFGKTTEHNLQILHRLDEFQELGRPLLIGPSRKSFIGNLTGLPVEERLEGTIAAAVIAAYNGANIVRVHDVKACKRALLVADAIKTMPVVSV